VDVGTRARGRVHARSARSIANPAYNAYAHITTSFVASRSPTIFFGIPINGAILGRKVIEHKMRVLIFSTTSV
jgi:hypothetical protein